MCLILSLLKYLFKSWIWYAIYRPIGQNILIELCQRPFKPTFEDILNREWWLYLTAGLVEDIATFIQPICNVDILAYPSVIGFPVFPKTDISRFSIHLKVLRIFQVELYLKSVISITPVVCPRYWKSIIRIN